jgi:enoyl-CoA hydratase/carnithine racemase
MPLVNLAVANRVATITLDNPPLNLVNVDLLRELESAIDAVIADPAVRVVILTGAGERAFCAGSNLNDTLALKLAGRFVEAKLAYETSVFTKLANAPKPTIAAVRASALGGGLELMACCDMAIVASGARFGLPEIHIAGFPPTGAVRVARAIGPVRAREMVLLGNPIDAETALRWGLVTRVVGGAEVMDEALRLATELAGRPARAMQYGKRALQLGSDLPAEDALREILKLSDALSRTADGIEGAKAFVSKRAPHFVDVAKLG